MPQKARIEDIDVIRGFALFGVLMMNLMTAFRVPFWSNAQAQSTGINHVVGRLHMLLLSNKSMTLFSILFGAGLAIFFERARERDPHAKRLLMRRLFFLLLFGAAHMFLLWDGDILISYALSGMLVVLFFIERGTKVLLIALGVALVLPSLGALIPALRNLQGPPNPAKYEEVLRVYAHGSYLEVVRFRAHEVVTEVWHGYVLYWPHEVKNMLLGILIWRSGILRKPLENLRLLRWTALVGIVLGATFPIWRIVMIELFHVKPSPPSPWVMLWLWTSVTLFALGYGAGIVLLLRRTRFGNWVAKVAPLGRMAFTNYLTESIVWSTVFYGYGLGLIGKWGEAKTALLGIGFFILQGIFSTIWLRHFRFGPFEWAWRSLTYGQWQPFRRHRPTVLSEA